MKLPDLNYKKLVKAIWITFASLFVLGIIFIISVSGNWFNLYGPLPSYKTLENPESDLSSELWSSDGELLGKYFTENRTQVTFEELSDPLVNTLLATEDIRFLDHSGVDLRGLIRVFFYSILLNRDAGGGSTITQQLAKNLFRTRQLDGKLSDKPIIGIVSVKAKEWIVAVQLERAYTKKEIMAMYLNTVSFGSNAFGIKTASQTFFNKEPHEINYKEAAVLVGILQAPSRLSPVYNPENAIQRRNVVLGQLEKYDFITEEAQDTLSKSDLGLNYNVENQNVGLAPYFRSVIRPFLYNWARDNGYNLSEDGLKIYTTINANMQRYAETSVTNHMKKLQKAFFQHWEGKGNPWIDEDGKEIEGFLDKSIKRTPLYRFLSKEYKKYPDSIDYYLNKPKKMTVFSWQGEIDTTMSSMDSINYYKHFLHAGFMAVNPHNGKIKAWVGGIDHKYFQYDHVMQGKRQPGSTFKPIVYTAAIDNGYSPCYELFDSPNSYPVHTVDGPSVWTPKNFERKYSGEQMTIRQAMARSVNSITAAIMYKIGPETVVDYAHRLGIESELDPVLALSLGTSDVSVFEMVGAYSTFVNKGVYTRPRFIERIEDKYGNVIVEFPPKSREAISEGTAFKMIHMFRGATEERGGTAIGLDMRLREDNEVGAKTGTTDNASDMWFMGLTKDLVAGVWIGGDDRAIHFRNFSYWAQGARAAMPIWENFMLKVYEDEELNVEKGPFPRPQTPLDISLDCSRYENETFVNDSTRQDNDSEEEIDPDDVFFN
mgnify:CR=1 FL=1